MPRAISITAPNTLCCAALPWPQIFLAVLSSVAWVSYREGRWSWVARRPRGVAGGGGDAVPSPTELPRNSDDGLGKKLATLAATAASAGTQTVDTSVQRDAAPLFCDLRGVSDAAACALQELGPLDASASAPDGAAPGSFSLALTCAVPRGKPSYTGGLLAPFSAAAAAAAQPGKSDARLLAQAGLAGGSPGVGLERRRRFAAQMQLGVVHIHISGADPRDLPQDWMQRVARRFAAECVWGRAADSIIKGQAYQRRVSESVVRSARLFCRQASSPVHA
jgi:hypothetical protein